MIPHHDPGAVGVHRANISECWRFNQEGRTMAGLREDGEIRADFAAHHKEALVGPFHVQFGASSEVELRHVKGHGGLRAKANRGLEDVVVARAFRLSVDGRVGGAGRGLSLRGEGVGEVGGHARHGTEALRQQRIHRGVDRGHQLFTHGVGTRPSGLFVEEAADQIGRRPVVLFKTVKLQGISKHALVKTKGRAVEFTHHPRQLHLDGGGVLHLEVVLAFDPLLLLRRAVLVAVVGVAGLAKVAAGGHACRCRKGRHGLQEEHRE